MTWIITPQKAYTQDMPLILSAKTSPSETGLRLEFVLSSYIKREDVSSWIEQENWFMLNFYNIIRPDPDFFKNMITYPVREVQQNWLQNANALQLSIQVNRSIGVFDVIIHDEGRKVIVVLTYSDFIEAKEANPSFIFPDEKGSQKKSHPMSWKESRERTSLEIICDTKGLPIYVDGQMVGISPLKHWIDVLPGWHKVGYFPNDYSRDSNRLTSKEKILNDILIMGRLDVFVEEGKHETIVLNYQTLDEEVVDYNKRFQTGTLVGFSLFFTMILLISWGIA
ncbi:MAG: hypothetical protein CMG55_00700 [Candidatus Marinimicrobia bacterium]|nr:hypothetical protein [Candidatus Neomarinimicrobiota bacterium]